MLINSDMAKSLEWLKSVWAQVPNMDENMQLAVIEFIRKDCRSPGADKARYVQAILNLIHSPSSAVKYEAAGTLVTLSSHSTAIKAAGAAYIELISKEADNNVKLICLDRLNELKEKFDRVLDELLMDMLRVLTSPDIEVRRKCLKIGMDLVTSRNVEEVVGFLKKELVKTHDQDYEKASRRFLDLRDFGTLTFHFILFRTRNTASFSFRQSTLVPSNSPTLLPTWYTCSWSSLLILATRARSMSLPLSVRSWKSSRSSVSALCRGLLRALGKSRLAVFSVERCG